MYNASKQASKNDLFLQNLYENDERALREAEERIAAKAKEEAAESWLINEAGQLTEGTEKTATKSYAKSRPSYGKTQVDDVWNNYNDPTTGKAPDPAGGSISWDKTKPRQGQWDMGHIPGEKYSDKYGRYIRGEISQKEFLEWYRNPANYRPELPSTNRSHKYE